MERKRGWMSADKLNVQIGKKQLMFTIINMLIYTFFFLILGLVMYTVIMQHTYNDVDKQLNKLAGELTQSPPLSMEEAKQYPQLYFAYYDTNKNLIEGKGNYLIVEEFMGSPGAVEEKHVELIKNYRYRVYTTILDESLTTPENGEARYIRILLPVEDKKQTEMTIFNIVYLYWIVSFVGGLFVSILLGVIQALPYKRELERSRNFTSDMSHEINTPLSVIQTNIENLLSSPDSSVSEVSDKLTAALSELKRLKRLSNDLLLLSRVDRGVSSLEKRHCNISQEIFALIEPFAQLAELDEKKFVLSVEEKIEGFVDIDKIKQCIVIILNNAMKYTDKGDTITVKIEADKKLYVTVADSGIGVGDHELEKIFERFYRSERSRSLGTGGTGLGLSIVHSIVLSMHGKIIASHNKPKGFKIEIIFPLS